MTRPRGAGCRLGRRDDNPALVMHRAYQDNATRQPALDLGYRRIFTRFEKLDALFLGFILFALIVDEAR